MCMRAYSKGTMVNMSDERNLFPHLRMKKLKFHHVITKAGTPSKMRNAPNKVQKMHQMLREIPAIQSIAKDHALRSY